DLRHPKATVACVSCGTKVVRRIDQKYRPTCSTACRTLAQWGDVADGAPYDWAADAVVRARKHGARVVEQFDREQVFARDGWRCCSCDVACTEPDPYVLTAATV